MSDVSQHFVRPRGNKREVVMQLEVTRHYDAKIVMKALDLNCCVVEDIVKGNSWELRTESKNTFQLIKFQIPMMEPCI